MRFQFSKGFVTGSYRRVAGFPTAKDEIKAGISNTLRQLFRGQMLDLPAFRAIQPLIERAQVV